jgi:phage recombination protein Bet
MADATATAEKNIVQYEVDSGVQVKLSPAIVRKYLVQGQGQVSDQEVMMFLMLCRDQKLNPFVRDCYLIKYGDQPATMVTGKDAFTKRAEKHSQYDGCEAGVLVVAEGGMIERAGTMVLPDEKLVGGWARVHRKDRKVPSMATASMDEYMGRKKDGTPNRQWTEKPATMIRKVALVQALRETFPDSLGGLYDAAEMTHVDGAALSEKPVDVEPRNVTGATEPTAVEALKAGLLDAVEKSGMTPEQKTRYAASIVGLTGLDSIAALKRKIETELAAKAPAADEQKELV